MSGLARCAPVVVTFTTDRWSFGEGIQRVEGTTVGGRAVAHLVADGPDAARVWASFEIGGHIVGMGTLVSLEGAR